MVNNAGIFCGLANIVDESVEAFDKTMVSSASSHDDKLCQHCHRRGVFLGTKYVTSSGIHTMPNMD
jgi:hypothetical protein